MASIEELPTLMREACNFVKIPIKPALFYVIIFQTRAKTFLGKRIAVCVVHHTDSSGEIKFFKARMSHRRATSISFLQMLFRAARVCTVMTKGTGSELGRHSPRVLIVEPSETYRSFFSDSDPTLSERLAIERLLTHSHGLFEST